MKPTILCLGNPDRGDDAAGVLAAARLNARVVEPSRLPEAWAGAEHVILVDAVVTGAPAGTIHCWDASQQPLPRSPFGPSTHALGVAEAVELARALGNLPQRIVIYGIEGTRFEPGSPPTLEVVRAAGQLADLLSSSWKDFA